MKWTSAAGVTKAGDLVLLMGKRQNYHLIPLIKDGEFQTHRGVLHHNDLIGKSWGSMVESHQGNPFYILQPGIEEIIHTTKRNTQIMYAKDIGYLLIKMNIVEGSIVIEAGTGSGALTQVLAAVIGDAGHLFSYEAREEMQNLARKNLHKIGLEERVTFIIKNIEDGFDQENVQSLFLDLPNPYDYIEQVKKALIPGGFFGCILPTTNQVVKLITALRRRAFVNIEVSELMLRHYQAEETKLRPADRMVAHTGYLIFARSIEHDKDNLN
jgi:tRNA (adenine57-N1/adenine58-N1)-methyltransferase catalytic subunit